jgi:hypothetical protein
MNDLLFVVFIFAVSFLVLWRAAVARAVRAEQRADYLASRIRVLTDDVPAYAIQGEGYRAHLRIVQ